MTAARCRQIVAEVRDAFHVSERRACGALGLARSSHRYRPVVDEQRCALVQRIEELAGGHPRFGYRRIWALLVREGWSINIKAVHRLWRVSGLKLGRTRPATRPRLSHGQDANGCHLRPSRGKDDVWAWDIVFDRTGDGRSLKWLTLIDEYTRECLALEARRVLKALDVQEVLAQVVKDRGAPSRIRSDNGPEFAAEAVRKWVERSGFETLYIAPGSPWQNGYAESFHSRLRDEFLEREEFDNEPQAQEAGSLWKEEYNTERPHSSLSYQTPAEFAATSARREPSESQNANGPITEQTNR
jgi:transposase InsO family protein